MFSQVREDPNVEISVHNKHANMFTKRYLLTGSGGCTLFTLLSLMNDDNDIIIDVIDNNISQLYLIQLKLQLIKYFKDDVNALLDFFEGNLNNALIDDIFENKLTLSDDCKTYWNNNKCLLYSGINQNGTFELLFHELVTSNYDFEKVFNRKYLIDKFGEDSVVNSLNHEFYDHFMKVINLYENDETNYFYHQIKYNRYSNGINYINNNIFDYIVNTSNTVKYDIIHTSNITDWMNNEKGKIFATNICKSLNEKGSIIMRRLNGDYELSSLFPLKENMITITNYEDKSKFYSEVIVATMN
jgi:S-adenosylmethionine:diacylglycerol 3-amino-3-carboxypropyl transferase